jgi:hypothetical protein
MTTTTHGGARRNAGRAPNISRLCAEAHRGAQHAKAVTALDNAALVAALDALNGAKRVLEAEIKRRLVQRGGRRYDY